MADRRLTGVVLAGGAGRRFGAPKAYHVHRGRTLAEHAARKLDGLCDRVVISVGPGMAAPPGNREVVVDAAPARRGPLAGLAAAWSADPRADLLVLACDYPAVPVELLRELRDRGVAGAPAAAIAVAADGCRHPLVAWWNRELRAAVETALAAGLLAVRDVLDGRPLVEVRPAAPRAGDDVLTNVNRIADLPAEPPD